MKPGRTLMELAQELTRQAETKQDYLADTRRLHLEVDKDRLVLEGVGGGMPLRPTAHAQLADVLKIPKGYYDRCLAEDPALLCKNVNRWLGSEVGKAQWLESNVGPGAADMPGGKVAGQRKLIRTLDGQVRAILSDSYRPLDNLELAEAVLPALEKLDAQVMSSEVTESRFYLKAVSRRITGQVKVGQVVQAGIVVSNSEIGQGALKLEALDYWLSCLNGAIRDAVVKKAHLGRGARGQEVLDEARLYYRPETQEADDRAFFLKVRDTAGSLFRQDLFENRLLQYRETQERTIEADPAQVVEVTAKRFNLNDTERGSVLKHLILGGDLSQYGLANAVTRAAQDVDSYDRSQEMEAVGGDLFQLPKPAWKALAIDVKPLAA